jgi:hypothetical protein
VQGAARAAIRNFGRKKRASKFRIFHHIDSLKVAKVGKILETFFLMEGNHAIQVKNFHEKKRPQS